MALFMVIVFATFMDGLDGTIVSVVLPDMAAFFDISTGDSSWVITIYFLMMAGLILIFGKICDRGAIRMVLLSGLFTFTLGALLSGMSVSFAMLLIARGIQGVGAAMLASSSIMLAVKYLPKRIVAMGIVAATAGESVGSVFGPVLGGIISEALTWEWIFYINVPVGIIALAVIWRVIPKDTFQGFKGFDIVGSVLLFISMVCGLYCMEYASTEGMDLHSCILVVVFAATLVLFAFRSVRVEDPVINPRLFKTWKMNASLVTYVIVIMCGMGVMYLLPFYITKVMGYSTMESGLLIFIPGFVTLIMCLKVGGWVVKYGSRPFVILSCVTLIALSLALVFVEASPLPLLLFSLVLLGFLWGFGDPSLCSRIINLAADEDRGACSSLSTFIGYLSVTVGTAFYSVMFDIGSGAPTESIVLLSPEEFMAGFILAMAVGAVLCVVALILAVIVRDDDRGKLVDDV